MCQALYNDKDQKSQSHVSECVHLEIGHLNFIFRTGTTIFNFSTELYLSNDSFSQCDKVINKRAILISKIQFLIKSRKLLPEHFSLLDCLFLIDLTF